MSCSSQLSPPPRLSLAPIKSRMETLWYQNRSLTESLVPEIARVILEIKCAL